MYIGSAHIVVYGSERVVFSPHNIMSNKYVWFALVNCGLYVSFKVRWTSSLAEGTSIAYSSEHVEHRQTFSEKDKLEAHSTKMESWKIE